MTWICLKEIVAGKVHKISIYAVCCLWLQLIVWRVNGIRVEILVEIFSCVFGGRPKWTLIKEILNFYLDRHIVEMFGLCILFYLFIYILKHTVVQHIYAIATISIFIILLLCYGTIHLICIHRDFFFVNWPWLLAAKTSKHFFSIQKIKCMLKDVFKMATSLPDNI